MNTKDEVAQQKFMEKIKELEQVKPHKLVNEEELMNGLKEKDKV